VAVRKLVRNSQTPWDQVADHRRLPSAPPTLGSVTPPAFLVAADYLPAPHVQAQMGGVRVGSQLPVKTGGWVVDMGGADAIRECPGTV